MKPEHFSSPHPKYSAALNEDPVSSNKKLFPISKKSNIKNLLPPIQIPKAKRVLQKDEEIQNNITKQIRKLDKKDKQQEKLLFINNNIEKQKQLGQFFSLKEVLSDSIHSSVFLRVQRTCKILSFIYNEFHPIENVDNQKEDKLKVYENWQLLQIQENYKDTNLGDFIIKMVNPDNLPEDYLKQKKIQKNQKIALLDALQDYEQIFNTEKELDKNMNQCQKSAFQIAFYLLQIGSELSSRQISRYEKVFVQKFMAKFQYFLEIENLTYLQYIQLKKKAQFKQRQINLNLQNDEKMLQLNSFSKKKYEKSEIEAKFTQFKVSLYKSLKKRLVEDNMKDFEQEMKKINLEGKKQERRLDDENSSKDISYRRQEFVSCLLLKTDSISSILSCFPQIFLRIQQHIKQSMLDYKNKSKKIYRKLYNGGYLTKVSHQGELKWMLAQSRPQDFLTLTRKFIIYKLTRRGGLFIRNFLSKEETHIYLVIKASEQHLEQMAQKSNFNLQIQLGAMDIFSFEPVDKFGRPLRCNKYLRDVSFIKKYNLANNKQDKDESMGQKSVESEALNIYKKAFKMNKDELRAKIILDQEEADSCFSWLSEKTGTRYIQPDQILNNSYNTSQIQGNIWPIYFVYNKIIIQYLTKLKLNLSTQKNNKIIFEGLSSNIGLILRLMFLKALNVCNEMYRNHRKSRFRSIRNLFLRKLPLQNIWNLMGENVPRGYFPYFYSERLQKIWRKFQINQQKHRSKFSPAARLINTNSIIREYLNISKSIIQKQIQDFYPIHDPFILKNIKVRPYLNVLSSLIENNGEVLIQPEVTNVNINNTFVEYQCQYTKQDFTKQSMQQKLKFKLREPTQFSVNSVAFYCGQKIAFFFQFRRYLTESAWPLTIITFIIQIFYWVENSHIVAYGQSSLRYFNNALMVIMVVVNTIWTETTISGWVARQKKLARSFGTNQIQKNVKVQKRVLFQGEMSRNLQTNQINDQKAHPVANPIKQIISFFISLVYTILTASTILIIFALKSYLLQSDYPQSTITVVPAILITIAIFLFNFIYGQIICILVDFENKKTVSEYQNSLTVKSFVISFIVTYFALFIYGFFSQYFQGDTVCTLITSSGAQINNCYFYISSQLVTTSLIDLAFTIVWSVYPLAKFYYAKWQRAKLQSNNVTFNLNYFQSIDCFYQEQDRMETFMHTDQIDMTWKGYIQIVITFTTLILFAPFVPFLFLMMFVSGVVELNAKKYEIIYFSKRTLPIKVKSIGNWINVMRFISVVGVFTNCALLVYIRNIVTESKAVFFFSFVFVILALKYILSFERNDEDQVGKRCKAKTEELIHEKGYMNFNNKNLVNTDIQNLYYNQQKLKRKLPILKAANIKYR